jgi:hypothetical protein
MQVGAQLTFTMLTSIVNPAIPLISSLVSKCLLPCVPLPLLQEDLNNNMVRPDVYTRSMLTYADVC